MTSVGEQLAGMLNLLRRYDQNNPTSSNGDVSLMSLVWPLLPLLPPQPPPLLTELLRETDGTTEDKCDMCGKAGKTVVKCCGEIPLATDPSRAELRHRKVLKKRSSLDKMVDAIEHKLEETLNSIEQSTIRSQELDRPKQDLYESGKPFMTDAELLNRLKSLIKQRETHEQRVKSLEIQKQKMEESLITAITWAKDIKSKSKNTPVDLPLNKHKIQCSSREDIINAGNIASPKGNGTNMDQQNFNKVPENEDNYYKEENDLEEPITEIIIDQQPPLEIETSEVDKILENVFQESENNDEISINHLNSY